MPLTRRRFLALSSCALAAELARAADSPALIIDIHQHVNYRGRADLDLVAHQKAMGVTTTVLLPSGTPMSVPSTHSGKSNGLAAMATGNASCQRVAHEHPGFVFGSNEVTDTDNALAEIEAGLKAGGKVIGEQKFGVECDSTQSQAVYQLAQQYGVPVLLHFQHLTYNLGYDRFHTMLEKFPKVNFIGHAQTVWANIDKNHADQKVLYPKGPVTPGGLTDVYLARYANFYVDMSAGSGLGALLRDEEHARGFIQRHQDKMMFGSDCTDVEGKDPDATGKACIGAATIAAIRRLAGSEGVERKLLYENAKRVFRL